MNRADAIRDYAERCQAERGKLPSSREVSRAVGGDTRTILRVLRECRGGENPALSKPGARDEECRAALRVLIPALLTQARWGGNIRLSDSERERLVAAMRSLAV